MNLVLLGVLAYVVLQLGIAFAVSRTIRSEQDYILAGRSLGYLLAVFSIFATWFGAETCLGSAGAAYEGGIAATYDDPFAYGLCLLVMGVVFAVPLYRRGLTTVGDLFRQRFGPVAERIFVLLIVPSSLFWAAAQIRAFGQVLATTSTFDISLAISIAAVVVIVYTAYGGMLADAWTDLIQGLIVIAGLILLAFAVNAQLEDTSFAEVLVADRLTLRDPEESWLSTAEGWAIPVLGSLVAQELIARVLSARTRETARNATILASVLYVAVGLIPVTLGLIGPALVPNLEDPEQILIAQAREFLPTILYVVFAGALVSAILSTVDSALLAAASLTAHNAVIPLAGVENETTKLRVSRISVVIFGLIAWGIAMGADSVYGLVEAASSFATSGGVICFVFALFTGFGGQRAAVAALLVGMCTHLAGDYVLALEAPYVTSLLAAFAAFVLAGFTERANTAPIPQAAQ